MRKKSLFLTCVFCLLLVVIPYTNAQNRTWWEDGCDSRAINLIAPTTTTFDYTTTCAQYRQCDPNDDGSLLCQQRATEFLLAHCTTDDVVCQKVALLYSAAILAFDMPFGESIGWTPPQTVIDGVPIALAAASQGDYQAALEAYQLTPREDYPEDTMIPFSRGVVYELLGNPEAALTEYASAMDIVFEHPLVWYARSQLYGSLGRLDEASFDAAALLQFTSDNSETAEFGTALAARYPLDTDIVGDWLLYPVSSFGGGPGGEFLSDLTVQTPIPVRVGVYESLNSVLVIGVSQLLNWNGDGHDFVQLVPLAPDTDEIYSLVYPSYWDNAGRLRLQVFPNAFYGTESISFFEGYGELQFLIAPVDAPDPRIEIYGTRHCDGGILSRVQVGTEATSPYYGDWGDPMYDAPNGAEVGRPVSPMLVIGGPECVDARTWWQVQDGEGTIAWMPETTSDHQYTLTPMGGDVPIVIYCPQAPAPRLSVGEEGLVILGLGENNLRSAPDAESENIGTIAEGDRFMVLGNPVCADGYLWWNVDYRGTTGWTAEGEGSTYWLTSVP